ncbi:hypothetical protein GWK08_13555 [Leptobacterium flavescens]|uniref:SbsA Ig-like domain-containing protein n=1 Tax=Leptobacterium flavescens TaxID=472055 RepID=A0A6P0UMK5_9FLAO|nr:Ig-like domain-containing protein [Leptobacterium flavescens]NER14474.1 hypothetical protein [Leptobacterium flavescens]
MKSKIVRIGLFFAMLISLINCAKRGTPSGGARDTTPPKIVRASPELNSTNFDAKRIRIYFDEYVKLNNLQQQLIVSPPLSQLPQIKPQGSASKVVEIVIKDTLRENTTYVINFGQSIVDNNEGNAYPFFKYVFSTGPTIDSLTLSGFVTDAKAKQPDTFISVMLYEIDSTFTDSTIYKKPPTYITNTLDSTTSFQLSNLRAGKYRLIALKDIGNNNLFNQKTDKIAFVEDTIQIPTDSVYQLNLFKEIPDFRATPPSLVSKNRIIFGYEGLSDEMEIELLSTVPDDYKSLITKERDKDTLNYWFTPFEADSLLFKVSHPTKIDTFNIRIKELYRDSLVVSPVNQRNVHFEKPYVFRANIPLVKTDSSRISIFKQDSVPVPFDAELDKERNEFKLKWNVEPAQNYLLTLYPNSLEDFYGNTNDTIRFAVGSKSYADLGSVNLTLRNVDKYPVIIQITDEQGEVKAERYVDKAEPSYEFRYLDPGNYLIRVIFDTNGNGKWDSGSYLLKTQPERIAYFPDVIELRANWELQQTFTVN